MKTRRSRQGAPRVLVIYKKSAYELYARERRHAGVRALLDRGGPAAARLRRAHRDHAETLTLARRVLADLGAAAVFRHRSDSRAAGSFDLVVTLGGDGTLLRASHVVGPGSPVVAINTAPQDSVGYYCAGTKKNVASVLKRALNGKLRETKLTRMCIDIDGETVSQRVLNDILFCHASPAATTRYSLRVGKKSEEQKSSGVWIATAAGSTAAIRSAGGRLLPIASRRLQYVVREPYVAATMKRPRMLKGFVGPDGRFELVSSIRDGRIYMDGPHLVRVIEIGSHIEIRRSEEPLSLLGFQAQRRNGGR